MGTEPRYPRAILASVGLPWAESWEFQEDLFRDEVRAHLEAGIRHLYIFGTAGEGYAVTDRMFDEIVGVFRDEMAAGGPDTHAMVGVINQSTRTIVERIEQIEEEIRELTEARKEIYLEAKGNGFEVVVPRKVIKLRKQDEEEREEHETLLDIYRRALGMLPEESQAAE